MARQRKLKVRRLSLLLLKEEIESYEAALRNPDWLDTYNLKPDVSFTGCLYVKKPQGQHPSWTDFLCEGTELSRSELTNVSNSAVLFVSIDVQDSTRIIAITFGYGRNLLNPDSFVRDFGLKVTLNTVDPERLRSIDVQTVEELTVHTQRQASQGTPLETFGLDISRDLLRGATGEPKDRTFARRVTGKDSLVIHAKMKFSELGEKCRKAIQEYESDAYKDRFGWIDHLRSVRTPETLITLDGRMVNALRERDLGKIHLAPPELIDWERVDSFTYSTRQDAIKYPDLHVEDLLTELDEGEEITLDRLKSQQIHVYFAEYDSPVLSWSAYKCVVSEVKWNERLFVLSAGQWYEIDTNFASSVDTYVQGISIASITLPGAIEGEKEKDYNRRAAESPDLALLDSKLIRIGPGQTPIEACDLFSVNRQFIHVKKKTHSATLSHLFAQGTVSAETFIGDSNFRAKLVEYLGQSGDNFAELIEANNRPQASDFEVVYAIVTNTDGAWPLCLPFFSRLHLKQAVQRLRIFGFNVSTIKIPEISAPVEA